MGGAESRAVTKHSISAPSYADTLPPDFISGGICWHLEYQGMILPPDFLNTPFQLHPMLTLSHLILYL